MGSLRQNSQSKPSTSLVVFVAITFGVIAITSIVGSSARAGNDDYMFCESGARGEKKTYFSAIFLGDYSRSSRAKLDFHSYLEDAGKNPDFLSTFCWVGSIYGEDTYEKAKRKLEDRVRERQRYPYDDWIVLRTDWKPGYSVPPPASDEDGSRGRESGGDGCYFGECPDDANPAPESPDAPIPSRQASQRTLICKTKEGWCEMSGELPVGVPCGCLTLSGPVGGITVRSRP